MLTAGAKYAGVPADVLLNTETQFLKVQLGLEDAITSVAQHCGKKAVVICDRGVMDIKAYVDPLMWAQVLEENGGVSDLFLRDRRYDACVHLTTAAIGAENFYTTANNSVRTETVEMARELDSKVMAAWVGHRNHFVIDNAANESFDDKIARTIQAISSVVGLKCEATEKLFKVGKADVAAIENGVVFQVETHVLDDSHWVLRRSQNGANAYVLNHQVGDECVRERILSARDYVSNLSRATGASISKTVTCFRNEGLIFSLEEFSAPAAVAGLTLLRVKTSLADVKFPACAKDVTAVDLHEYSDSSLAAKHASDATE